MFIGEVVESSYSFKSGQKDPDTGDILPIGSLQIRIGGSENNTGQVRNIFARPAVFNRRVAHIGDFVYVISAPVNDWSTSRQKGVGFLYFSPINSTDDLAAHTFPRMWKRKGLASGGGGAERKSDREEPGYTWPKNPTPLDRLQPFEGDDLIEGRTGHSIRLGSTIEGDLSVYEKKTTWQGGKNGDPILILRASKPTGDGRKYAIEDISKDASSIYMTSMQKLSKLKAGFDKNMDAKQIGQKEIAQIVVDSDRVVLNAKKDMLFLIGKEKAILTGKKVILQSDKYKVDLDELMDFLKKWLGEDTKLHQGSTQLSTASGPTAVSTAVAKYIQLQTADFQKFKMP